MHPAFGNGTGPPSESFRSVRRGKHNTRRGPGVDEEDTRAERRPYTREHGYNSHRSGWDDDRVELVTKLWGDGLSATEIAHRIGGVSRNAVIGKLHRLGLVRGDPRRKAPSRKKKNYSLATRASALDRIILGQGRVPFRAPPVGDLPAPCETDIARLSFLELDDSCCKFIPGEPKGPFEKQFCGLPAVPGLSWCVEHAHRCGEGSRIPELYRAPARDRIKLVPTFDAYVKEYS